MPFPLEILFRVRVEAYCLSSVGEAYVPYALAEPVFLIKREDFGFWSW